jgi:hypothetical protein
MADANSGGARTTRASFGYRLHRYEKDFPESWRYQLLVARYYSSFVTDALANAPLSILRW